MRCLFSNRFEIPCAHGTCLDDGLFSVRTQPIGEENRGFRLLKKMGWKQGQGLGVNGDGITVPVVLKSQVATLGLGKSEEDDK